MSKENETEALDEVLVSLHEELEDGASADRVAELVKRHPEFRKEILAFAAEWLANEGSDLADDMPVVGQTVSGHAALLERFWAMVQTEPESPLPNTPGEWEVVADKCRIDTAILRKIVKGFVEVTTIPGKLITYLAEALDAQPAQVWSYLNSPALSTAGAGDFFAPSGRAKGGKSSFADVIRKSDLGDEDKQFWLYHLAA